MQAFGSVGSNAVNDSSKVAETSSLDGQLRVVVPLMFSEEFDPFCSDFFCRGGGPKPEKWVRMRLGRHL